MLKKIRIVLSVTLFSLITFYFLDFAGILPIQFHALTHIQFVPALLALNFGILAFLVLLTLLFGRIYCSSVCPMGIFQDIVSWVSKRAAKKKKKYTYSPPKNILRWSVLGAAVVLYLFGITALLGLLDPYAAYGWQDGDTSFQTGLFGRKQSVIFYFYKFWKLHFLHC